MRKLISLIVLLLMAYNGLYSQETDRNYEKEAISRIRRIHQLLDKQTEYPFDDLLQTEMSKLSDIESMVEDKDVLKQIDQVYSDYDEKKRELHEQVAAQAQAKEDALKAEEQAQKEREAQAAQQLKEEQEAKDKENKKQRVTMIVIVIVMAVLFFVANQLIQYFRNKKTQRDIMQMQQQATQAANPPKVASQIKPKEKVTITPGKSGMKKGNGKRITI